MRSREVLYLVRYEQKAGDFSDEGESTPVCRKVYGNLFSDSFSKKLSARVEGLRIAGQMEIYTFEYAGEPDLKIGDKTYKILDVSARGDRTVLTYGEVIADGY